MSGSQGTREDTGPESRMSGRGLLCGILKVAGLFSCSGFSTWKPSVSPQLRSPDTSKDRGWPWTVQIPFAQEDLVSTSALMSCHLQASEQISKSAGETGWEKRGTGIRGLPGPTSGPERSLSGHPCEHELHPESYKQKR